MLRVHDPLGNVTSYGYDANGNTTCLRTPRGHSDQPNCATGDFTTTSTYDRFDELLTQTQHAVYGSDDDTLTSTYDYDRDGNQIKAETPGAARSSTAGVETQISTGAFDGRDQLQRLTQGHDGDSSTTDYEYDAMGNLRRAVDPDGVGADGTPSEGDDGSDPPTVAADHHATVYTVNAANQVIDRWLPWGTGDGPASDPTRFYQHFERDGLGRVTRIDAPHQTGHPDTNTTRVTYDFFDSGWIDHARDYAWNPDTNDWDLRQTATYGYDKQGNQTSWSLGSATHVTREYWPNGLLGRRHAVKSRTDPTTRDYSYGYDANGSLVDLRDGNLKDPSGDDRRTTSIYDDDERLGSVNETWANGKDTALAYDADGNVITRQTDGALSNGFANGKTTLYDYDSIGRERRLRVWRGAVPLDQSGAIRTESRDYWPSGAVHTITRSGADERRYFDTQGRLVNRTRTPNGGAADPQDYTYNGNGDRTRDEHGTYGFNARHELSSWTPPGRAEVDYELNGLGNVSKLSVGTDTATYVSSGDRLKEVQLRSGSTLVSTKHYSYDDGTGAMTCAGSTSASNCDDGVKYTYDDYNRLLTAKGSGSGAKETDNTYDGLDRRETSCTFAVAGGTCGGGAAHDYGYVGMSEALSSDTNTGTGTKRTFDYTSLGDRVGQDTQAAGGDTTRSYVIDPNGTVDGLEDSSGQIAADERYDYSPYGEDQGSDSTRSPEAAANPFRFEGFPYDAASGTYDMQARPYRPDIDRFTTPDRFEDSLGDFALQADPLTEGRYGFAGGNPVNRIEFDGHDPITSYDHHGKRELHDSKGRCMGDCRDNTPESSGDGKNTDNRPDTYTTTGRTPPIGPGGRITKAPFNPNNVRDNGNHALTGFAKGFSDEFTGLVTAPFHAITHPAETGKGIAHNVTHPGDFVHALKQQQYTAPHGEGAGHVAAAVLITLATAGAGTAAHAGAESAETAEVASAGSRVPEVTFSRSRAPGIAQNFDKAVANGAPTTLNRVEDRAVMRANRRAALRGQKAAPAGQSLDEYPFACTIQGGAGSCVRAVPAGEQSYQGGKLSSFFQQNDIRQGDPFRVRFTP